MSKTAMEQVKLLDEEIERLRKQHDHEIRKLKERQRRILAEAEHQAAQEKALAKRAGK